MRKPLFISAGVAVTLMGVLYYAWNSNSEVPRLEFQRYVDYGHGPYRAILALHNTTKSTLWITLPQHDDFELGEEIIDSPYFLRKPANKRSTNSSLLDVKIDFMAGARRIAPGESLPLREYITTGQEPIQLGVVYYAGNFQSESEFLRHVAGSSEDQMNRILLPLTTWNARLKYRLRHAVWWLEGPKATLHLVPGYNHDAREGQHQSSPPIAG